MTSKRYFSLISGAGVHAAPGAKIIPADVFSKAVSAQELLDQVTQECDGYKQQIASECEKLKEQAQQEGFQEGYAQWTEHLAELEREIANVNAATERMIIPVALKAARKIVGREIELSENAIVDIVASKLKAVSQAKQIIIYVSPEELEKLESHRKDLATVFEKLESLSIRPNEDLGVGSCIIETETGIINAQLEKQWEILEHAFQSLMSEQTQ